MPELNINRAPVIFLADDDEDDVYFVRTAIRELDPDIKLNHYLNGRQLLKALNEAKEDPPTFVLLDLNMPVLDGRETLRVIKEKYGDSLPVIILSTSNHEHEKEICFEYGASFYYTKPCSYPLYLEILKKIKADLLTDKIF